MFWQSVIAGLKCLTFWQTYVAGLIYFAIVLLPFRMFMQRNSTEATAGYLGILLMPLLQMFGTYIFVLTLAPIILGTSNHALWNFPWQLAIASPLVTLEILGVMVFVVLCLTPILKSVPFIDTLALGVIVLIFAVGHINRFDPDLHTSTSNISVIPGFFFIIGILFVSVISFSLAMLAVTLVVTLVSLLLKREKFGQTVALRLIGSVFGFIPVFIYGSWLGLQIKALPGFNQ